MQTASRLAISFLLILSLMKAALAQESESPTPQRSDDTVVTAFAVGARIRFTSPASVVQIRLEVYNSTGRKMFDNEVRGGNVLDWRLQDGQAEPLADDTYLCVVTVKSLSGRLTQRIGAAKVEKSSASVQAVDPSQMTAQQSQAIGPVEANASLTVLKEDDSHTATNIGHNGEEALITRDRGALSFRIGDLFTGKDIEQMRLTPEGNLGIGISHPQVRLDVDGLVRASQGIVFPDGSVQFSAAKRTFGPSSLAPGQSQHQLNQGQEHLAPDTTGTGTTGKIAKWLDGPNGVLNDSNITELSGAIGINGTPNPNFRLDVNGSTRIRGSNPGFNLEGLRPAGNTWLFQTVDADGRFRLFGQDNVNPGAERLTISLSGNIGIGTSTPLFRLDVRGGLASFEDMSARSLEIATSGELNVSSGSFPDFIQGGRLKVTAGGNVGIGNPAPTRMLEVAGNILVYPASGNGDLRVRNRTNSNYAQVTFSDDADVYRGYLGYIGANGGLGQRNDTVEFGTNGKDLTFRPSETEIMRLTPTEMRAKVNTVQDRDKGGWVKAMAFVDGLIFPGEGIIRCYNSQASGSAVSTVPCGFTYIRAGTGHYVIDFGFPVDDRFILITPRTVLSACVMTVRIDPNAVTANQVRVHTTCADTLDDTNSSFYISIF